MATRDIYEREFDESTGQTVPAETNCPECGEPVRTESGETSCVACGLILDEYQLTHSAQRYHDPEDRRETRRTGAPLTEARHDRGLSSEIGRKTDANGNTLSGKKRRQMGRLRREHSRAQYESKAERNLAHACGEIARITSALELPRAAREAAAVLFRRAQDADLIVGRSIESMAAGSVYGSCRTGKYSRSLSAVVSVAKRGEQKVQNAYDVLNVELGLETPIPTPQSLLPRVASKFEISAQVRYRAVELATLAEETGIANGRKPSGVAAACLYLATNEHNLLLTQEEIADAAGTTSVTLRNRYKELQSHEM